MILNLHWAGSSAELTPLQQLLDRHARKVHCASQRTTSGGEGVDLSYRLLLRDPDRSDLLLKELQGAGPATRVTTMKMEDESEV
jgi:hypothetical protein